MLTTTQAAAALGVSRRRVQALITNGRLPAAKVGRDYLIDPAALRRFAAVERLPGNRTGRPRRKKA